MLKKFLPMMLLIMLLMSGCGKEDARTKTETEFLNVSCDPPRELYAEYNDVFKDVWQELRKEDVKFLQMHDASSKQAQLVIDGMPADVVTLSLAYDVNRIQKAGLIRREWIELFPYNSAPYTSTIVFLVRAGNPKNISDWNDLIRDDVSSIALNPKISGGARWNYLAAWEYGRQKNNGDEKAAREFVKEMYANVEVLNNTSRETLKTFVDEKRGDVLIAWENEALRIKHEMPDEYDIVTPSISILAEPSVAVVDEVVDRKGTRRIAEEYIRYLYSVKGQEIAAKNFYRPRNTEVLARNAEMFKPLTLVTVDDAFGGWEKAHADHFADGAIFDQIYKS